MKVDQPVKIYTGVHIFCEEPGSLEWVIHGADWHWFGSAELIAQGNDLSGGGATLATHPVPSSIGFAVTSRKDWPG